MSEEFENEHPEQQERVHQQPQPQPTVKVEKGMTAMQKVRLVFITILGVLLIIFVAQNYNDVNIEFLSYTFRAPLVMVILFSAIIGAVIALLMARFRRSKRR